MVYVQMPEMGVKESTGMMLSTPMLVNMRNWSLQKRDKQGKNSTGSEYAKAHSKPILVRCLACGARS
jgi:hypothetical protein